MVIPADGNNSMLACLVGQAFSIMEGGVIKKNICRGGTIQLKEDHYVLKGGIVA
jgi:hypothetical protein